MMKVGSCAAGRRDLGQVRKEAALSGRSRVPQECLAGVGSPERAGGPPFEGGVHGAELRLGRPQTTDHRSVAYGSLADSRRGCKSRRIGSICYLMSGGEAASTLTTSVRAALSCKPWRRGFHSSHAYINIEM